MFFQFHIHHLIPYGIKPWYLLSPCLVCVKRLWISGDDPAQEWARPAWLPCQLRGHCGRCGALRLCLAGRAEAGQPAGGDLQGGRGHPEPWADDRSPENLCHGEGCHYSPTWWLHPTEVGLRWQLWAWESRAGFMYHVEHLLPGRGVGCYKELWITCSAESSIHGKSDTTPFRHVAQQLERMTNLDYSQDLHL